MSIDKKQPAILQVLPSLRSGGVERGTVEIAAAIRRRGWRSLVASSGGLLEIQLKHVGAEHIKLPLNSKNPLQMLSNISLLDHAIRKHGVSLIHARSRAPAWSAWCAAARAKIPFMTTFHGTYGLDGPFKQDYNSVMVKGERVIGISHFIEKHIKANYNMDTSRLRVIHRGVDTELFDVNRISTPRMAELVKTWRIPEDLPLILMPARFTRWKGHEFLIQALAALPHRKFYCVMFGDREEHSGYQRELAELIRRNKLEGYVVMSGSTTLMPEAYMLASVVVCPSTEPEAFGRVPVEAQAMGKPVVGTNHGGACETVLEGDTGWLVPPFAVKALSTAIHKALTLPPEDKINLAEKAMAHVRRNFSTEVMCRKTIEVYEELLTPRA